MMYHGIPVKREAFTNRISLYTRLSFRKNVDEKIKTANKAIGLMTFLVNTQIVVCCINYKLYVRSHLDNGDMI